MKKVFIYIMFAVVGLTLQSCLHDNDEVFELSAAERIDAVLNETESLLEGAQYGWALHYYLGEEYAYGGITYAITFKDGKATFRSIGEYETGSTEHLALTSTYKLNRDQGPVLIFDTYNDLLHYYADPAGGPTDVDGAQADFNFVIMNISEDKNTIKLQGKRWGNNMTLERLTKPAEEYLAAAEDVAAGFASVGALKYVDGSFTAKFYLSDGSFTVKYTGEDGAAEALTVPFTYTDKGLLFNEPIELNGNTIEGVQYAEDAETFALNDSKNQSLSVSYDAIDVFQSGNWYIAASNLGEVAAEGFKSFTDACRDNEGERVDYAYIGTFRAGGYGFCFMSGGRYAGLEVFDVETEGEDLITFSFGGSVSNGSWYRNYDNLGDATEPFYNTFKLTSDDAKNPTYFTLTDVNNAKNVIKLVKTVISYPAEN